MFRRSGSTACYFVEGSAPDPQSDGFVAALREHRFRTIENAASEETSVGWVTQRDPTGDSFEREDLDQDAAVWLRMRIDKKKAPTKWLQIYRQAEERAAGRKLSAKERKELREDLLGKLLPRVLPSISMVDALYFHDRRMVLLFGTSTAVQEAFLGLFYKSFSVTLTPADPYHLALSLDLGRERRDQLDEVAPVRWSQNSAARNGNGTAPRAVPVEPPAAEEAEEEVGA